MEERHHVKVPGEILECFANRTGRYLDDLREKNKTTPKTQWFISETDYGKKLKIVFIMHPNKAIEIKSAFEPNANELFIYNKHAY
jgi:hypothetical protein